MNPHDMFTIRDEKHKKYAKNYVAFLKRMYGAFRDGYKTVQWDWAQNPFDERQFRQEVRKALNKRIWLKGNPPLHWRKMDAQYQIGLERDVRILWDLKNTRIRHYQFNTKEMRQRFGHLLARYDD